MKKFLSFMLAGVMMFSLAGCGGEKEAAPEENNEAVETEGEEKELEDFDIVLDWYPNAVHSFMYVAMEKGYYADEGLKVNIQFPANPNDGLSMPAAGKADAGIYYQSNTISTAANNGVPIKVIGSIVQHPLNVVMSLGEKNITSPADLAGKVVGYPGTADNEFIMKGMMESVGLKYEDVTMQDVGFDLNTALVTENVDAIIGGYINHEYPTLINKGYDINYFEFKDAGVPDFEELILVTGEKQIEEEPEKLAAFIRASKRGFEDVKADPQAALEILLANQDEANYPLDPVIEQASMDILLPLMYDEEQDFLEIDKSIWDTSIEWLAGQGLLENEITTDDLIVELENTDI